ncbi:uncharacterized protein PHACADRAFT_103462 [Phanerochaete carnosa HHB-10118-sp]|uniref:Uncharacterized protein n=1 Tax=Phanerochaete carnosa (strain HHB-10118-sp) TaxID=650164 RepID=K5WL63_PHACS|nr:uncharacterized protein PHACADRAFT_103462 [Phanerochaete carnosa HHB-10118-sp]EKM51022.1 hypothetical protein PHACADRAFT_103462 [Phanerochaete carnosa HHB-10118-sp]
MRKAVEETSRELEHVRTAHNNTKTLLATRTAELRDAQAYLTKTDAVSNADVQRMIEGLNAQIFQLSALVADSFTYSPRRPLVAKPRQNVGRWLGTPITDFIYSYPHSDDNIWVQLALQTASAAFASRSIGAWDLRFNAAQNRLLTEIHKHLFNGETQAISARWRVLSRRYIKQLHGDYDAESDATEKLVNVLKDILLISGAREPMTSIDWLKICNKAKNIITESVKVQKAIGEDIASTNFQVVRPLAGDSFDTGCMADVEDCGRRKKPRVMEDETVVCTTELGLRRFEKTEEGGRLVTKSATLLKAKVVLLLPPGGAVWA